MSNIESDESWKSQAQKEKSTLAGEPVSEDTSSDPAQQSPPLPPASFLFLLEQFLSQAYFFLGLIPHPSTGKLEKNLDVARHAIDMLGVIQEKTKGNLTPEEERILTSSLHELRMAYVKIAGK